MRALSAWLAIAALLLASLAPAVSHALSAAHRSHAVFPPGLHEICTGSETASSWHHAAGHDGSHLPSQHDFHAEHCPFCRIQSDVPVLPPLDKPAPLSIAGGYTYPPLFYVAPSPLFAWVQAQPRAPPLLS